MSDGKVSRFPGRRSDISRAVAGVIAKEPVIGGSQGDFQREPCGTCISWRRDSRAGTGGVPLNAGMCLFGPPTPFPIMGPSGEMLATIIVRAPMKSDSEGCDQHDDGTEDEDDEDDEPEPASLIQGAG